MKQTVYIASPESQQIHVWNLNHEGALTLTQVVDVPGQVQPMVVSPDKRYLYVGVRPEFRVLAYRIAPAHRQPVSASVRLHDSGSRREFAGSQGWRYKLFAS